MTGHRKRNKTADHADHADFLAISLGRLRISSVFLFWNESERTLELAAEKVPGILNAFGFRCIFGIKCLAPDYPIKIFGVRHGDNDYD